MRYLRGDLSLFFLGLGANTLLSDKCLENSSVGILGISKVEDFYQVKKLPDKIVDKINIIS